MEYLLFTLQIITGGYFLTNKVATTLKLGYLIYLFIVVVSIILFYLMFKMEFSKLVMQKIVSLNPLPFFQVFQSHFQ